MVIHPNGKFAYIADSTNNKISAFAINASTGALTPIPGSPFGASPAPGRVTVDPTGRFLYALYTNAPIISGFAINNASGALTPIPGSPFTMTGSSSGFFGAVDPIGKFLYIASNVSGNISGFAINSTSGALTTLPSSPFPAGSNLAWLGIHPSGAFLYVDDFGFGSGSSFGYTINTTTGALTRIPGQVALGGGPDGGAMDPNGRYLYISGERTNGVLGYKIDATTGSLTAVAGSPFPSGFFPAFLGIDPLGKFLFAPNLFNNNVSAYSINAATGALTTAPGSPFLTGANPQAVSVVTAGPNVPVIIVPTHGGNAGTVTVQITGSGFQTGATVKLTGIGSEILGTNTTVPNASVLSTTFDLTGATPGVRNVVVTNPDNTTTTLTGGFTVEQGGAAQISVSIVGRDRIRFSTAQTYYGFVQNHGIVDAANVAAIISQSDGLQPMPSAFFGTIPALSSMPIAFTAIGPVGGAPVNCPVITGGINIPKPLDPCVLFEARKAVSDAYLTTLYVLRRANFILWLKYILPLASGGTGLCFNPTNVFSSTFCDGIEGGDDFFKQKIQDAQNAQTSLCFQAAAAGCPLDCHDPTGIKPLDILGESLNDTVDQLKLAFTLAPLPLVEINNLDARVALFQTQALALPNSPVFPPETQPPTALPADEASSLQACGVGSLDPNSKTGAPGFGPTRYVQGIVTVPYLVSFENIPTATAPAQSVKITDTLDTDLDLTSLTLGPITFPNQVITPPAIPLSVAPFTTTVDLRPTTNLLVKINASLNTTSGILTWIFQSLDPATNQPPSDPLAGFLPPSAEGSVFFTVMPKSTVTTGTAIQNTATIVFDVNAPINTPTWSNTIDNTKPTSHVNSLPATQTTTSFIVSWAGSDAGAGVQDFTVYASDNGGPFAGWQTNTTATSASFTGTVGHTYRFYSIDRDLVGNVESSKSTAEATTTITTPPTIQCTGCYFLINNIRATLAFNVAAVGSASTFTYNYRTSTQTVQFASTTTSQISVNGNTATFSGQGKLNGVAGYTFAVTAKDGGGVGSSLDTVSILITGPSNYSLSASGTIAGGDIVVKQ